MPERVGRGKGPFNWGDERALLSVMCPQLPNVNAHADE